MALLIRLELILPAAHTAEDADRLLALLALHAPHGWEERSPATGEFICIVYHSVPESARNLRDIAARNLPLAAVRMAEEEETDWLAAWKEFFTPVEAGDHFLVLAPWMTREREAADRIVLVIEPGTAFGTGHHESTALCLAAVSLLYAEGVIRPGMRFLDLGAGSGILGLACAKLGLSGDGLDTDPAAVENALRNRAVNGIAPDRFSVRPGSLEQACGPYDLVLANILAEPLRQMAPAIAALPCSDGRPGRRPALVLSGLLERQADSVEAAYTALGYPRARRSISGEWAALLFDDSTPPRPPAASAP